MKNIPTPSINDLATASPNAWSERTVTELDQVRLEKLLQRLRAQAPAADHGPLFDILDMADIVPSREIGPQVATVNSRVRVLLSTASEPVELTLRHPHEADAARGDISVLSPMGTALLGLHEGHVAQWQQADGQTARLLLLQVLYQPEAQGEYTQ